MGKTVDDLRTRGKILYENGNYSDAKSVYEEILTHDHLDDRSVVLSNIALCLFNLEDFVECATRCQEALDLDPYNYKAAYRLMLAREKLDQIDLALEAANKCAQIAKDEKHHLPLLTKLSQKWEGYLDKLKKLLESDTIDSDGLVKLLDLIDPQSVDSKLFMRIIEVSNGLEDSKRIKCWNFIFKCSTSNGHMDELLLYLKQFANLNDLLSHVKISQIILSILHKSHFENSNFWYIMKKSIGHSHLVESVFTCITNASQNKASQSTGHWLQEIHLLFEHLYNLIEEYPVSIKPAIIAIFKHNVFSPDLLKSLFNDEINRSWLVCMDSLFLANRDLAREIMCGNSFIREILATDIGREHVLLLSKCADFIELRKEMLQDVEGVERLAKKFGPRSYVVIGKLLIHSKEVEMEISSRLSIKDDFLALLDMDCEDELVLQSLMFISLHKDSKRAFLGCDAKKLVDIASKMDTRLQRFLFISFLLNLSMGEDDRKEMDTIARSREISYEQADMLGNVYNQLPDMAKNIENDYFILGPQSVAAQVSKKIIQYESGILIKSLTKWQLFDSLAALFMLYSVYPELRHLLLSCGVMSWILKYLISTEGNVKRYYGRSLIRICATSNPRLLSYKDSLDSISHIVKYLDDTHELYQYEAALALTNIASISTETRNRCLSCDAWNKFGNLLFSENEMLKAAGMEGWSNLCLDIGGKMHQNCYMKLKRTILQNSDKLFEINVMLAFIADYNTSMRSALAAASAVALLSMDLRIAGMITKISNFNNLFKVAREANDIGLLERVFTTFTCICQLESSESIGDSDSDGESTTIEVGNIQAEIKRIAKGRRYPVELASLIDKINC